jgi:enoyl-[acyl-carrier-protein] reductase (NADH)
MKYYGEIMNLIGIALEAAIYLPNDIEEDIETLEYFDTLREHILECITCVIHALKDMNKTELFNDYVQGVLNFITKINHDSYNPSFVY